MESIKDALDKLADGQEKFIAVLERIATQGEAIATLKKDTEEVFKRVRTLEISSAGERVKMTMIMAGVSGVTSGVVAIVVSMVK